MNFHKIICIVHVDGLVSRIDVANVLNKDYLFIYRELGNIANWKNDELKNIVHHFIKIRFPMFLVLNKCDSENAKHNVEK